MKCFPLPALTAEETLRPAEGRSPSYLLWSAAPARERAAAAFCYAGKGSQGLRH